MTSAARAADPNSLTMQVAREIAAMMARREITRSRLAQELGVSHPWVSDRLRGITPIGLDDLERIAEVLEVLPLDLFPRVHVRSTETYLAAIARKTWNHPVPEPVGRAERSRRRPSALQPRHVVPYRNARGVPAGGRRPVRLCVSPAA